MELKEEIDEYVEQKVTYIDDMKKDGDDKKPFFTFVDVGITQTKVTLTTFFNFWKSIFILLC